MSFTKLHFDSIVQSVTATKASYQPNFICPNCKTRNVLPTKTTLTYQSSKTFDFNQKIAFTLPCCGAKVELFVAIHKEPNESPVFCIQRSDAEGAGGIPANWWVRTV